MIKIFLDANILFSVSCIGSATRIVFDAAVTYADECITNPHAFEEAKRNLEAKRPDQLSELESISKHVKISHLFYNPPDIDLPAQDIPILAGAIGAHCSHLWTGDKTHFGKFYGKTIHGVQIVSSILLADFLFKTGWKPVV